MMLALPKAPEIRPGRTLCYLHLVVPSCFKSAVDRHHAHLVELAELLAAAQLAHEEIAGHLDRAVESYRAQLLSVVDAYSRNEI